MVENRSKAVVTKTPLLLGDMQFFNDGGEANGQQQQVNVQDANNGQQQQQQQIDGGNNGEQQQTDQHIQNEQQSVKTFTQEQLNGIVTKETRNAQEKIIKQLGAKDFESAKEGLKQLKEFQDSQKTEAQRLTDTNKTLSTENEQYKDKVTNLEAQVIAMKAGVSAESVEDVVTLAKTQVNDDLDMSAAIDQIVKKYPNFKGDAGQAENGGEEEKDTGKPKPSFVQNQYQNNGGKQTETEKWASAFSWGNQ